MCTIRISKQSKPANSWISVMMLAVCLVLIVQIFISGAIVELAPIKYLHCMFPLI